MDETPVKHAEPRLGTVSHDLFESYAVGEGVYDEMFGAQGIRETYTTMEQVICPLGSDEMRNRSEYLKSTYLDQGVTFDVGGEERPFPLDIVPRIVAEDDWAALSAGVRQRVKALEAFLADVYGAGHVFDDGVIPRHVVTSSPHFHRVVSGLRPPNGVRVHVAGIDLIRDAQGTFRVLEDNVRVPSGVSYVLTNRRAMSAALPEVFSQYRVQPVHEYVRRLLAALRAAAPSGIRDPNIVVLTPGVYNSAYFEHALLARQMGVELVEGRDLVCQNGRVQARTTRGLQNVHVIYRRVDDDFLDPVYFRRDSMLGVAGLLGAARAGNVTIANGIGNGVADDKLVYTYLPDLVRYYLAEEPLLKQVDTWRLEEPAHREEVMDRLEELVVKPVDGSGGKGIVIGPLVERSQVDEVRAKILTDPRGWIAQPMVQLSTVPTMIDGKMAPRHVDLRPFAVNDGDDVWVLPGGLTRVALPEGELIVNSSQGGGSKDTWVLGSNDGVPVPEPVPAPDGPHHPLVATVAEQKMLAGQAAGAGQMEQQMSASLGGMTQSLGGMSQGGMGQGLGSTAPGQGDESRGA